VVNALENMRDASLLLETSLAQPVRRAPRELREQAREEIADAARVLAGAGLHPEGVALLVEAGEHVFRASASWFPRSSTERALIKLQEARAELVGTSERRP
jgi:hypothetical protein